MTLNGYAYANNSPVTQWDPTGLFCDGCSSGNPDTAWTPDNGPGCTHNACYDHGGDAIYTIDHGGGTGGGGGGGGGGGHGGGRPKARPEIVPGVEIPTEEDLRNRGYDPFGNQAYTQLLVTWSENRCMQDPSSNLCGALHQLGWISPSKDFLELIGVRDAIRCAQGSVSACVWTAVGLLPIGKLGKAAKLLKKGNKKAAAAMACFRNSFTPGTQVLMTDGSASQCQSATGDRSVGRPHDLSRFADRAGSHVGVLAVHGGFGCV